MVRFLIFLVLILAIGANNTYNHPTTKTGGCRADDGGYGNYMTTRHVSEQQCKEACDTLGEKCDAYDLNKDSEKNYWCGVWCETCKAEDLPKSKPVHNPDFVYTGSYSSGGAWKFVTYKYKNGGPVTKPSGSGGNYCHMRTGTVKATTPKPTDAPKPTAAPTPVLPIITDVKSCWCREDPHCVGFSNSELFHFPKVGDFSFYKNSNIEIRTRQEKPTNRPKVFVISGVVFKGKWTCDQKIEITRGAWGTYKNSDEKKDYKNNYKPVLAVDGTKTEGAGNIISKLTSLFDSCNFITFSVRSGEQRTLDFKFPDDSTLAIQKWMHFPGFGTTVALNLHKNHYDEAADTGVCVNKDSQTSTCSENMFTQFSSCVE